MSCDKEPKTDAELIVRLTALYAASDHSEGARADFWDCVSLHIGWVLTLATDGAKARQARVNDALTALEEAIDAGPRLELLSAGK